MKVVWLLAVFIAIVTHATRLTWSRSGDVPGVRLTDIDVDEDRRHAAQAFRVARIASEVLLHTSLHSDWTDKRSQTSTGNRGMDSARD
ncbi:unnamed protein product [Leuciscus chuanchicus]